ncbi:MAG: insecticidal toxin protein [Bacteroidota bacterium]
MGGTIKYFDKYNDWVDTTKMSGYFAGNKFTGDVWYNAGYNTSDPPAYTLFNHTHPYATELVRLLLTPPTDGKSTTSLQALLAADTRYMDDDTILLHRSDKGLSAFKGYFPVETVIAGVNQIGRIPFGTSVTLDSGEIITLDQESLNQLPVGTRMTLRAATNIALPQHWPNAPYEVNPTNALAAGTLMSIARWEPQPEAFDMTFFGATYNPSGKVLPPFPIRELDFGNLTAYSEYNWELFYHGPFMIALHLSRNQRFEEAQKWFHMIFDPTDKDPVPGPQKYWKVKPFQYTDVQLIENLLINMTTDTKDSISDWKKNPFKPYLVARFRYTAYMAATVFAYIDNLVAWGDSLFRQDTRETIQEATQLYTLAAGILGPKPQVVPDKGNVAYHSYASLRDKQFDDFGNVLVDLEVEIPFATSTSTSGTSGGAAGAVASVAHVQYFCIPRNSKLLNYWTTVGDRLFKIHNSLNLQGIFRQLPLFDPPIDPALLAKAAAAGLDVAAILSGLNQPLPIVRYQAFYQKAVELCNEVKALNSELLSATEKEDNERFAILRARQESVMLDLAESVKYTQWQEAIKSKEGILKTYESQLQRYVYYEKLLGASESDIKVARPDDLELGKDQLEKKKFNSNEPAVSLREITQDIDQSLGQKLSHLEVAEMAALTEAREKQESASVKERIGAGLSLIPDFPIHTLPIGVGVSLVFGGTFLSKAMSGWAGFARSEGDELTFQASKQSRVNTYNRREQDWAFQSNMAAGDINQTYKQYVAAWLREANAEKEYQNHKKQIEHAKVNEEFLINEKTGKKANQAFYLWMKREIKDLHRQAFDLAFDMARKAERALQHELGDPQLSLIKFDYMNGKDGMQAGQKLLLDLRRMDSAYTDRKGTEKELAKTISVLQLNPQALISLRATGKCSFIVPEGCFDLGCEGFYFRRITNVAVSLPCVTGPNVGVHGKLTLVKSSIRKNDLVGQDGYARQGEDADRFSDFNGGDTLVTSTGLNDNGRHDANPRDDVRSYFQGYGCISEWIFELPSEARMFDYNTITDLQLHMKYTARDGGAAFANATKASLRQSINDASAAGSSRLFSIRHEFPSEWARFKSGSQLKIALRKEHYPYWSEGSLNFISSAEFHARYESAASNKEVGITLTAATASAPVDKMTKNPELGDLWATAAPLQNLPAGPVTGSYSLDFDFSNGGGQNNMKDLFLIVSWCGEQN